MVFLKSANKPSYAKTTLLLSIMISIYVFFIIFSYSKHSFSQVIADDILDRKIGAVIYSDNFLDGLKGLQDGLRQAGYKNEKEITYTSVNLNGDIKKLDNALDDLYKEGIKILYVTTTPLVEKIKTLNHKYNFHIVFNMVADPLLSNIVKSMRKPENNITGVSHAAFRTAPKRLEIFKQAFPDLKKILVLYDYGENFTEPQVQIIQEAATSLGVEIVNLSIKNFDSLENNIKNILNNNYKDVGIFMGSSPKVVKNFSKLQLFAEREKIPIMAVDNNMVKNGAAIGYAPSFYEVGFQTAHIISLILRGINPSDIPVHLPDKIELMINITAISKLDDKFNPLFKVYSDKVYK